MLDHGCRSPKSCGAAKSTASTVSLPHPSAITSPMFRFFRLAFGVMFRLFRRRGSLVLENLVLRQQVSVLKRKNRRPRLAGVVRGFWGEVGQVWPGWQASR